MSQMRKNPGATKGPSAGTTITAASASTSAAATPHGSGTHAEMTQLADAKDRGQLSATSAMSIINVGMLREVIRLGSRFPMYIPLLVLLSISITLQVVAGALSLMVSNMKSDFQKFKSFTTCRCSCRRFFAWCCCRRQDLAEDLMVQETIGPEMTILEAQLLARGTDKELHDAGASFTGQDIEEYDRNKTGKNPDKIVPLGGTRPDDDTKPEVEASENIGGSENEQPPFEATYQGQKNKQQGPKPQKSSNEPMMRLATLANEILEKQDSQIELKILIPFLDKEISTLKDKQKHLKKEQAGLTKAKIDLLKEQKVAAAQLEQLLKTSVAPLATRHTKDSGGQKQAGKNAGTSENNQEKLTEQTTPQSEYNEANTKLSAIATELQSNVEQMQEIDDAIRQAETELKAIIEERDKLAKRQMEFDTDEEKFKIYSKMMAECRQRDMLKRLTYWQQVINYILYAVFIVNAFITAFTFLSDDAPTTSSEPSGDQPGLDT